MKKPLRTLCPLLGLRRSHASNFAASPQLRRFSTPAGEENPTNVLTTGWRERLLKAKALPDGTRTDDLYPRLATFRRIMSCKKFLREYTWLKPEEVARGVPITLNGID